MVPLPRHWLRCCLLGSSVLLLAVLPPLSVGTAAAQARGNSPIPGQGTQVALAVPAAPPHFLYEDEGGVLPFANSIAGYQVTRHGLVPTPGSPYPTNGGYVSYGETYGANYIASSGANGPCLFLSEQQTDKVRGQVESFAVNATTGALTAGSSVPLPAPAAEHAIAGDIHASADGRDVYVTVTPQISGAAYLDVLAVGRGCALTLANVTAVQQYYYWIGLVGTDGLMAVEGGTNQIDLYRITHGIQLSLISSTPSQGNEPLGAASGTLGGQTYVFTSLDFSPGETEAYAVSPQGHLTPVPGSPATAPASAGSGAVWFDPLHGQLVQSETVSNTLSIYGRKNGQYAYLSHAALALGTAPGPMAQLGVVLFVVSDGSINACLLRSGAATCVPATRGGGGIGIGVV
jgi:hypothetical protein